MSETTPASETSNVEIPGRRKRINRREQILRTAAGAFATQGFNNTSLADIAAMLNITPAGVLHHFGSKTDLLTAVLELRDDTEPAPEGGRMLDHLIATAERNTARPGTTQLYAVLSAESATADHPAQEWFRDRYKRLRREITAAFLDRSSAPEADDRSRAGDAAAAVIAVMDGLQVQWLLDPEAVDMPAVTELVIDALATRLAREDS